MENRAEFRLGKRIFLGILGNLGSKIDPWDLSKKTRASGYNGHGKRGKVVRERREMSKFFGSLRMLFIGGLRSLVRGCTLVRSAYAYVMHDRSLDCLGFGWDGLLGRRVGRDNGSDGTVGRTGRLLRIGRRGRSEAKSLGYAGRTGVRSAYLG